MRFKPSNNTVKMLIRNSVMKSKRCIFIAFALFLTLSACANSNPPPTPTDVADIKPEENKMDNQDNDDMDDIIPESNEPQIDYNEIHFGDLISLDFVEFTIDGASSGDEIRPDKPERVYSYKADKEDEKYIYLYGTIKNVSGEKFEFADNMYAKMTFDDKYNYSASIAADEGGSLSYIYADLNPLKSEKFYILASIPDELAEQYTQVVVKFGFAENFDGAYIFQEDECDYLYSVTVTK